jgi:hypothetical protein
MDLCSKTRRERLHWPLAAAAVLMLAAAPAFGDDERHERGDPYFPSLRNPCFKDPATNGQKRCSDTTQECEFVECNAAQNPNGCGTQRTTTKDSPAKDGRTETRIRRQADGFGTGNVSLVKYTVAEDDLTVIRTRAGTTRIVVRNRDQGSPQRKSGLFGSTSTSGACSLTNPDKSGCASPWVNTVRTETVNGVPTKPESEPDVKCKNRDGRDRRDDED